MELERVRRWFSGAPGMERVQSLGVDYHPAVAENGSVAPAGVKERGRRADVLGNVTVEQEVCFRVLLILLKNEEDDGLENAQWLLDLQKWVQEQGARGLTPVFGAHQQVRAEEGTLKQVSPEGTGVYSLRLTFRYETVYEVSGYGQN